MAELSYLNRLQSVQDPEQIKLLADPIRLSIMRRLMAGAATLSQLSRSLDTYPARVRHHVTQLEEAGFIILTSTRVNRGYIEKYYQATARAFVVNLTLLPEWPHKETAVAWGSHDLALERVARLMQENEQTPGLFALPVGSLDGLIALRQGRCQIAGCHLFDAETGQYNSSHVRHIFPGQEMLLLTLAFREQGLLVAPGNPLQIRRLSDLVRPHVRFVNRARGTGTRLWLDLQLQQTGISPYHINGYDLEVGTHLQVAQAIAQGKADVGLAIVAAAYSFDLDVVPLFAERYDLVLPADKSGSIVLQPLFDYLQTSACRREVRTIAGYDAAHTGEILKVKG